VVALLATTLLGVPAQAAERPRPVLNVDFPDPAVVATRSGLVGYSTGERVPHAWSRTPRGRWRSGAGVLTRHPRWAAEGGIWAVDVARVRGEWLLYYAVPVDGIAEHGRCIGVARSRSPRGPFRPVGRRPLVCPSYADTPRALDPLLPRDRSLPRAGVIDPSVFVDADGAAYLLYKTDRIPSSIRLLQLSRSGTRPRAGEVSRELMRSPGVIENPVLAQRSEGYVLLLSEGDWTRCGYTTVWRRSPSLLDWSAAEAGVLLDKESGLCGPGGADFVDDGGRDLLFLHGWTCRGTPRPCEGRGKWDHRRKARGLRALYAARLRWEAGLPVVSGWLVPR
jgi:arabinan endo-1,5-alpha-L-arabinosidase